MIITKLIDCTKLVLNLTELKSIYICKSMHLSTDYICMHTSRMPVTLYYYDMSPQCRAVNLTVHALGINVDYKTVDLLKKEQMNPEFVKVCCN